MVQLAKDGDQPKEKDGAFADVKLPLPIDGQDIEQGDVEEEVIVGDKRIGGTFCRIFSISMNIALIIIVVALAVKVHSMQKELNEMRYASVELSPSAVEDNGGDSIKLDANVDKPNHDKLREIEEEYGMTEWVKRVRCRLIIIKIVDTDGCGWWGGGNC